MARDVAFGGASDGDNIFPNLADVKELWNVWEIHVLILVSLFLQVFLFLCAGIRRRSSSRVLQNVLWIAYLSADFVAIFVLGHLAVHASEPRHQLMSLWAPFVLIHLGGQDTITAFSKQDNELWGRHLLSLVTQAVVAAYVVAKASLPDRRLKAAMVLMFLSGIFKYAERIWCLHLASPYNLKCANQQRMSRLTRRIRYNFNDHVQSVASVSEMREVLDKMSKGGPISFLDDDCEVGIDVSIIYNLMSEDAPLHWEHTVLSAERLPGMLQDFLSSANRCKGYEYVEAWSVHSYQNLYSKFRIRMIMHSISLMFIRTLATRKNHIPVLLDFWFIIFFLYSLFHYVSTPIVLVLFTSAEKGDHVHTSKADITVSYILIIGAIILDVSSAIWLILSDVRFSLPARVLRIASYIQPAWSKRQWSEQLAQYSMIKKHTAQDTTTGMAFIRQWVCRQLGDWGVELLAVTEVPITEDHVPIKVFILDNLLRFGIKKQWNIASTRGHLALQNWISTHQVPNYANRAGKTLQKSINVDFPTSVLIWHIATDICYYGDNTSSNQTKTDKKISKKLSNYIMYLIFKCGVMLSPKSQVVHDEAHDEISELQGQQVPLGEKDSIRKLVKHVEGKQQDSKMFTKWEKEPADVNNVADSHLKELLQVARDLDSPVLPRACELAQELIGINDETDRWVLIAAVWLEKLYYIAPRCGCAFHYEHLSTGGEFITHVLLLMYFLGPFLPPKSASAS